ncbi:hypothetical protein [Bradyrhizobium tropiciagri]
MRQVSSIMRACGGVVVMMIAIALPTEAGADFEQGRRLARL